MWNMIWFRVHILGRRKIAKQARHLSARDALSIFCAIQEMEWTFSLATATSKVAQISRGDFLAERGFDTRRKRKRTSDVRGIEGKPVVIDWSVSGAFLSP
jgi:hypothetical protein